MTKLSHEQLDQIREWGQRNGRTDHFGAPRWFRNEKALLAHIEAQDEEIAALRRGQGTAPKPTTPGGGPFHVTHPIPDSRSEA